MTLLEPQSTMRIERVKNFISTEECDALNSWVEEGVKNRWLDVGNNRGHLGYTSRLTSRFYGDRFVYPQNVLDLSERIRHFCGVASYPLINGHGRDGIVVSCTYTGGDVYPHYDPAGPNMAALRCNILTRAADSGGELHIAGERVDVDVGELHCYLASEHEHYVSLVQGDTARVLWMFGAYVPTDDWNSGRIKVGV